MFLTFINNSTLLLLTLISLFWTIPLIFFRILGLRLYHVRLMKKITLIKKKLPERSSLVVDDQISGWIWGWPYIAYDKSGEGLYILTTISFYKHIIGIDTKGHQINIYERNGDFKGIFYGIRTFNVTRLKPHPNQKKIINIIKEHFVSHGQVIAMLYGKVGTGKSMTTLLLAKELGGSYCKSFNPTDPGNDIASIYNRSCPTNKNPLILVLEEADILIRNIHNEKIKAHKNIPTLIRNKTDYNNLFDDLNHLYPNIIMVLTSNASPAEINALDPCYLRKGRVDLLLEL